MGTVRAAMGRLESFFSSHPIPSDYVYGEPNTDQDTIGVFKDGTLGSVRWWWVLATGAGVGVSSYLLLFPVIFGYAVTITLLDRDAQSSLVQFGSAYGAWGMPTLHMLLTLFAASWVARRVGTAAVAHGLLIAVISVVVNQAVVLLDNPPISLSEAATYLIMSLVGGLVGGLEGQNVLAEQEALYRASRDISAARDPQAVLDAIGDYLDSPAVDGVALWQSSSRTENGSINGSGPSENWKHWTSHEWPAGMSFDGLDVGALIDASGGSLQTLRSADLPPRERAVWRSRGIRSALTMPLIAPGDIKIGLLAVASRRRRRPPRSTVRASLTVSAQAALVLENLRLIEEARSAGRQAGILRERQRMAHEIHDTLAQGFTSIVMNLEAAEGTLPSELGPARHHLDHARLTARESLTEARRLVWALRPEALESAPLPEALERLTKRWMEESGVAAGVTVTGTSRKLSPNIEATLFRTAQEALNNVRKHANASRVALTLSYMGDCVALDVRDDGVGFDPLRAPTEARNQTSGGFGLKGMRERVVQAGGALSVESAPAEGSTLTVELPAITSEDEEPALRSERVAREAP